MTGLPPCVEELPLRHKLGSGSDSGEWICGSLPKIETRETNQAIDQTGYPILGVLKLMPY